MRKTINKTQVKGLLQTAFGFATENGILYVESMNYDGDEETFSLRDCHTGLLHTFLWEFCLEGEGSVWFTYENDEQIRLTPVIRLLDNLN